MKRKFLSALLAGVMLLTGFAAYAYADDDDDSPSYSDDEYDDEPVYEDDYDDDMYLDEYGDADLYYYDDAYGEVSEPSYGEESYKDSKETDSKDADGEIKVFYQGKEIEFDVAPVIVEGRTLVPMRAIFERLGAGIEWDDETRTVTGTKFGVTVSIAIGSKVLYVNDTAVELDVPAQIFGNRTFLPLRAISEAFGAKVGWDGDTRTITINQA